MEKIVIVPEDEAEEFDDMGSHNHSMVQANLAYLFKRMGDYTVFIKLSLDALYKTELSTLDMVE